MSRPAAHVRQTVADWVESAREDGELAVLSWRAGYTGYAKIGFHAQQSVEKLLKALLLTYDVHPPHDHFIHCLRSILRPLEPLLAERLAAADLLSPFAVKYRYPTRRLDLTRERMEEVMQVMREASELLLARISTRCRADREAQPLSERSHPLTPLSGEVREGIPSTPLPLRRR